MSKPVIFMFSGQGSHYYQMGKEMYEKHPTFQRWMRKLDEIAKGYLGESVVEKIYDLSKKKDTPFNRTLHTHPAIFMVEYATAQVLIEDGIRPDYVMGASMGEFISAALAEIMSLEDIMEALIKQAEVLESYCPSGAMIAILDKPTLFEQTPVLYQNSEFSSHNFDSHFVVSAETAGVQKIETFLKEKGTVFQTLSVSQAFHSQSIEAAGPAYLEYLNQKTFQTPKIPFLSCVTGTQLESIPQDYFWTIVRKPIEFQKTVHRLESSGQGFIYLDVGASGTLANFVKYNLTRDSQSVSSPTLSPFGMDLKSLGKAKQLFV